MTAYFKYEKTATTWPSRGVLMASAGMFPDPYPDELLYSAIARYHSRVGGEGVPSTARELFGKAASIGLWPMYLDSFVSSLPVGHDYTVETVIWQHTLLPLFAPFMSAERLDQMIRVARHGGGRVSVGNLIGQWGQGAATRPLRYCPECASHDRDVFGETYWHRVHQVLGVEVCPHHGVYLQNSNVSLATQGIAALQTAEDHIPQRKMPDGINALDTTGERLLLVARDVLHLLQSPQLTGQANIVHESYYYWLGHNGLLTPMGINASRFLGAFKDFWPEEMLKLSRHGLAGTVAQVPWPISVIRGSDGYRVDPIGHALVANFLGLSVSELFRLPGCPFGSGPWHCFNQAADHVGMPVIKTCELIKGRAGVVKGVFHCECGYTYECYGPDPSGSGLDKPARVVDYGDLWRARLRTLHADAGVGIGEATRALGVSWAIVLRETRRLQLSTARWGHEHLPVCGGALPADSEAKLKMSRERWLRLRTEHPDAGKSHLSALFRGIHQWLYRNDRRWLEENSPDPRRSSGPHFDWGERDMRWSEQVRVTAQEFYSSPGRPTQVSRKRLWRTLEIQIGRRAMAKLPRTQAALSECSETQAENAARRVLWAAEQCRSEGMAVSKDILVRKSGLHGLAEKPEVRAAISFCIATAATRDQGITSSSTQERQ